MFVRPIFSEYVQFIFAVTYHSLYRKMNVAHAVQMGVCTSYTLLLYTEFSKKLRILASQYRMFLKIIRF